MSKDTQYSQMQSKPTSVLVVLLTAAGLLSGCQQSGQYSDSTQLAKTEIVPTLDTPLAESGNAVWCATFQVAWNRARDEVIGEPLQITNAQPVAKRLSDSPVTEGTLPSGSYFAAAGRIDDGIVEKIQQEMSRQFSGVQLPNFDGAAGFLTYAYLDTKAAFTTPYADTEKPIEFTDASGQAHSVSGFGLREDTDWDLLEKQAAQVKVLFTPINEDAYEASPTAFALDLTADQAEQQIIVAVLPRAEHLRAALDDLASRIEKFASENEYSTKVGETDILAIPNIAFDLTHEFAELQGRDKIIENVGEFQGLYILKAAQSIRFRFDKSGAAVISEAYAASAGTPRHFVVNRPFLVIMKRRSADQPYFVAWIENAKFLDASRWRF